MVRAAQARAWTDDPENEEPVEPEVTLFLATGNAMSGWYAARSAAHHIERENAWLSWPNWRLSSAAIRGLLAYVAHSSDSSLPSAWGRLALGLSLLSGRSFASTSATRFAEEGSGAGQAGIVIRPRQRLLVVPSGQPQLKAVAPETVRAYCAPHATTLRLPLPQTWAPLLECLNHAVPTNPIVVEQAAKNALAAFPDELAITERGVRGALKLALLYAGQGDLGLVKVVTDADGVNFNNLIHYSSYPRSQVEQHWRRIVHRWAGPLHETPVETSKLGAGRAKPATRDGRAHVDLRATTAAVAAGTPECAADPHVGTPYAIEVAKVAPQIAELKTRFRAAVVAEQWAAVNNLLTLYVAVWMGLATAGRSAREPVPGIILGDGWALVRDKHRPDESTDRYVPLGRSMQAQLAVLRSLTAALGLARDEFTLPPAGSEHLLQLRLVQQDGRVIPFRPKDVEQSEFLRDLPGNWGRKVVRSYAAELPGRFLDAGLGHWVRGRHPWSLTSTFPAAEFRREWLALQARLEGALGFEVLAIDGLSTYIPRSTPPAPTHGSAEPVTPVTAETTATAAADNEVRAVLANCHGELWYDAVFKQQPPSPDAALSLAKWAITHADGALGPKLADTAKRVCTYIRTQTQVPLFATRPRGRFQHNWLVKRSEFAALAYVNQVLLPGIEHDLGHLPARKLVEGAPAAPKVDGGRLIAALALRGGLINTTHLDTLLIILAGDTPLLAIGAARLVELEVLSRRAREPVRRTVILEPYLAALITSERDGVRPWLRRAIEGNTDRRQMHWNAALRAYLRSLGLPADVTLAMFLAAMRQRVQLQATPLLAAYASGELLTHDLSLHEFARLAACAVPVALLDQQVTSAKAALDRIFGSASTATKTDPKPGQYGHLTGIERLAAATIGKDVPEDVRASAANLPAQLCGFDSAVPREWLRRIDFVRRTTQLPLAQLLCAFAADLVQEYVGRGGHRDKANREADTRDLPQKDELPLSVPKAPRSSLSVRFKAWAKIHLTIVWSGLTGFSAAVGDKGYLDETVVQSLAESTEAYFPERHHLAAWSRFRSYLMDPHADHAGFTVGEISGGRPRPVSAKIMSNAELVRSAAYLGSVRSGLGAEGTRAIAGRHFALIRATGARRTEAAQLRWVDVDGDCLRIRPYASHTLKTPAAERVIPVDLLTPKVWSELQRGRVNGAHQLIDLTAASVNGSRFFDAEAKALKQGGGDRDLGPHHFRHTKANALLLKALGNCVDLNLLQDDFPWVPELLPPEHEFDVLLGQGGQCGQGLQAISMLIGHLHPTTTLKHYLHTLGVALYAYQLGQPAIPLERAFAKRMLGRATLYRRAGQAATSARAARRVRDWIEVVADRAHRTAGGTVPLVVAALLQHDPIESSQRSDTADATPAGTSDQGAAVMAATDALPARAWRVAELERWQRYFAMNEGPAPLAAASVSAVLRAMATIPSGKRGARTPRHPLPVAGKDGLRLPAMIHSASEVMHAQQLLDWLARLQSTRPTDYDWLLDKWLYASDVLEGSLRLGGEAEVARARALLPDRFIVLEIRANYLAEKRQSAVAQAGWRLRIRVRKWIKVEPAKRARKVTLVKASKSELDGDASPYAGRTTGTVRWVLTWLAARRGDVRERHPPGRSREGAGGIADLPPSAYHG